MAKRETIHGHKMECLMQALRVATAKHVSASLTHALTQDMRTKDAVETARIAYLSAEEAVYEYALFLFMKAQECQKLKQAASKSRSPRPKSKPSSGSSRSGASSVPASSSGRSRGRKASTP